MRRDSNVPRGKKRETERGESEARQRNGKERGVGVLRSEWLGVCWGWVGVGSGRSSMDGEWGNTRETLRREGTISCGVKWTLVSVSS